MKVLNKGKLTGTKKGTTKKSDTTLAGFVPFEKKAPGKPAVK